MATVTHDRAAKRAPSAAVRTPRSVDQESDCAAPPVAARLATLVQPRLQVGPAGDRHEQEADRIADQVVEVLRRSRSTQADEPADEVHSPAAPLSALVSRRANPGPIGAAGGLVDSQLEASLRAASVGGIPLPAPIRRQMEGAMGADFSAIRLHAGDRATALNDDISAQAFTKGNHIFFRDGLPDPGTRGGQTLLAHELVHTLQQGGTTRRSVEAVQRKDGKKDAKPLNVIEDWVKYSGASGKSRSKELKAVDTAVKAWVDGGRKTPGALDVNIAQIKAIFTAIRAWQDSKTGPSVRDAAINDLVQALTPIQKGFRSRAKEQRKNQKIAKGLYNKFQMIDDETGRFAGKNLTDVKQERFEPANQTAGLMAHTKKNDDGTLTDEALDELDDEQKEDAKKLVQVARGASIEVSPDVDPDKLRELMESDEKKNELSGRTTLPELANVTDPNGEAQGEVTKTIAGMRVTYDKSDVHAAERIAALKQAVKLINRTKVTAPALDVYFPKYGRKITVTSDCGVLVGAKIADAVFHPPAFLAVSSANTGNPKTDKTGDELKFLSAALGADNALVHTIIHEIGHALHYLNDRGRFYNLNFAYFKGSTEDGRSYQQIAETEVSGYGSNPREMVAEVFVGAVTKKKKFSKAIWEMYRAFGGADPR